MFRIPLSSVSLIPFSLLVSTAAFAQEAEEQPAEAPAGEEAAAEEAPTEAPVEDAAPEDAPVEEAPAEEVPAEPVEEAPAEEVAAPGGEVAAEAPVEEAAAEEKKEEEAAPEPSLLPLKVGTHTWSRFEYRSNYDTLNVSRTRFVEGDATFFRARLSLETNKLALTDSISAWAYMAPQASGQWGTSGIGGTIGEANLGIYEGYFAIKGKKLTGKVGRFAMNYGDAATIGNLDWHQAGRAFDGAHFSYAAGAAKIDAFVTQTSEGYPANAPFLVGDNYFWGLYATLGPAIAEGFNLDLYALGKSAAARDIAVDDGVNPPTSVHKDGATFLTLGARVKQKISAFDYRVEGGIQTGKAVGAATAAVSKFAYNAHGEAGVSFGPARVSLGGAIASGNDGSTEKNEAWDELYPTTHKWLGLMDVIGFRTNIISGNAGVVVKLPTKTILKLHAHLFSRQHVGSLGRAPDATSNMAGSEINAQVVQKIGKWAYARGLYGAFFANKDHYGEDAKNASFLEIQAGLKF